MLLGSESSRSATQEATAVAMPNIPFRSPTSLFGVNKRLVGFQGPGYADNELWNADEWSVTK
jgi:hypothetical protein